jgi:hypothetical protein
MKKELRINITEMKSLHQGDELAYEAKRKKKDAVDFVRNMKRNN